jgi:hypothetical protein
MSPDSYDMVSHQVKLAATGLSDADKAKMRLKERAFADYIFSTFEYPLYQLERSNAFFDAPKAHFMQEVVDYFTGRLLRNPRLLYFWSSTGGNLSREYETWTNNYYNQHVLPPFKEDRDGPLQ